MQELSQILQQISETGVGLTTDYSFSLQLSLPPYIAPSVVKSLQGIGKNKAGCVIAVYNRSDSDSLLSQPIVWLDSEGSPNAIFAASLNAFLSLLPYGSGFVYDVLSHCLAVYHDGQVPWSDHFEELSTHAKVCSGSACDQYLNLLSGWSLSPASDPVREIIAAFLIEPSFNDLVLNNSIQ